MLKGLHKKLLETNIIYILFEIANPNSFIYIC